MARKRMVDPKFWTDDKMMAFTPLHRLLFIGIWNFCDDTGIHKDSNKMLKAEIFPCDELTVDDVCKLKQDLIDAGLIVQFEDKGINLFYVKNWKIYQYIQKPVPSKYRLPEDYGSTTVVLPEDYGSTTVVLQSNRIERNGIKKKREEGNNSHAHINLISFREKFSTVDVDKSYKKFVLNTKAKGLTHADEAAAFEMWLKTDVERQLNSRKVEGKEMTFTLFCPVCNASKTVTQKERLSGFVGCDNHKDEEMVEKYELQVEKTNRQGAPTDE